jgi:hypothetical protein
LPFDTEVIEAVDGTWIVLRNGFQVGGNIDASGAGDATYETWSEALLEAHKVAYPMHVSA